MRKWLTVLLGGLLITGLCSGPGWAQKFQGKKIFYVDAYHKGYAWSDELREAIKTTLKGTGVDLVMHHMDTKRNKSEAFKIQAAQKALEKIEAFEPDVLIASDDNAFKYLVEPYFKDAALPVVFCGLNGDASVYGAPYSNTTGMIEISLTPRLLEQLRTYAHGERLAVLTNDTLTARKEVHFFQRHFDVDLQEAFVDTFEEWKAAFLQFQNDADILVIGNNVGISGWDDQEARRFVKTHTRIPTGVIYSWMVPYGLIGYVHQSAEQGRWAAQAALKILKGADPLSIPVVRNKAGKLYLNLVLSETLDILFEPAMLRTGEIFDEEM
jgi:hypothetical protein